MKKKNAIPDGVKLYDLIPAQQTIQLMVKYSFSKQIVQIPVSFSVDRKLNFDLMQKAFNIELERNDSMRLAFVKVNGQVKEYFRDKVTYNIPIKTFKTKAEQEEVLGADAKTPVLFFKGETFRAYLFETEETGETGFFLNYTHMIMDAMGGALAILDMMKVYYALRDNTQMPPALDKFEDYLVAEYARLADTKKQKKHEMFYREYFTRGGEPFYAGIHGPAFLEKYRKKKKNPDITVPPAYNPIYDKCGFISLKIPPEDAKKIFEYCLAKKTAPETVMQLGLRTHVSSINYRTPDVFMMTMCSKRATKKEKNMSGDIAQPLQIRTIIPEDKTFDEAVNYYTGVRTSLFMHSTYPYITARDLSREIYDYSLIQGPACMMFSWIPLPVFPDTDYNVTFKTYDLGVYFTPCYVITHPDPKDGGIVCNYMYRTKLSQESDVLNMHNNMLKVILEGIENPNTTIGELLDSIS